MNTDSNEKMLILHQNIVNLVKQLNIPLVEVSLVIAKFTKSLSDKLKEIAITNNENLPKKYTESWPLDSEDSEQEINASIGLEKVIDVLDTDRIDILDTLIRTSINLEEIPLADSLLVLRSWEKLVRTQLSKSATPGQLFSTVVIPDDF
ncbi:MAG TPA: hypothetical protein QF644_04495 [Candidatus Poseidoniaceae archaeon]|jgi:hypothetical protein|nr:hypothetical protein [Candidatus Poseidoniaceae archaeon]